MKSLFLKIFLSFWAAQALFLVLAILVTIALRPARHGMESEGPQILAEVVNAYQTGGERAARDYLEEVWHTQHVRAFIFDPLGRELSGRRVPPWIEDSRQGRPAQAGSSQGASPGSSARGDEMREGAGRHTGWMDSLMPDRIVRTAMTLDGKRYTLILELPPGPRVFFGPHDIPGLGIASAVITSGLMCYLLAWSLTTPVPGRRRFKRPYWRSRDGAPRRTHGIDARFRSHGGAD